MKIKNIKVKVSWMVLILVVALSALFISGCGGGAKAGDTVKVHYTGKFSDGTVFDSSVGKSPLQFKIGSGQVIKGFDNAVTGMKVGDTKTVTIPAAEAYGVHRSELVLTIKRDQVPAGVPVRAGSRFSMQSPNGVAMVVTITSVSETTVTVDGNHPMAGKDLTFELNLVEIK